MYMCIHIRGRGCTVLRHARSTHIIIKFLLVPHSVECSVGSIVETLRSQGMHAGYWLARSCSNYEVIKSVTGISSIVLVLEQKFKGQYMYMYMYVTYWCIY